MKKGVSVFVLVCSTFITTYGQQSEYDSIRDSYINRFDEFFFVWPVLKQRSLNFEIQSLRDRDVTLIYRPNNTFNVGFGLFIFDLLAELTFAVPLNEKSRYVYGESESRDLGLNIYGKRWGGELFHQRYTGFYLDNEVRSGENLDQFIQRPDIETRNVGGSASYLFNHQKFSFRSAYLYSERQLKSGGSWIVTGNLSSFRVTADSSLISSRFADSFDPELSIVRLRNTNLSISPGYTYSLIYKNFFLNGTLSVGPSHNWLYYQREDGVERNDITINTYVAVRIAIGYNGERLFGGLNFINQGRNVRFNDVDFTSNNGTFKILIGYRFQRFGLLRRSVWEFLPFRV